MGSAPIQAALERAAADAASPPPALPRAPLSARPRRLAVGDPQAPLSTFFEILDARRLLGPDGRLSPDVALVSMGDHFDWGDASEREAAARDGHALLAWLAAHPPDQVAILLGNHDLARVCELAAFDDQAFAAIRDEADLGYHQDRPRRDEEAFRREHGLPSWEVAARDLSTFRQEQRTLVEALLRARRLSIAIAAAPDLLLCHAGVTHRELDEIGVPEEARSNAFAVAAALDRALDDAVADWTGGRFEIPGLHKPGDAELEGDGMFYHRPATAPGRRRFVPHHLPLGLTQVVGHVDDPKSRELLGMPKEDARHGPLRHLRALAGALSYAHGMPDSHDPEAATMIFVDGGMRKAERGAYELFDIDRRRPA